LPVDLGGLDPAVVAVAFLVDRFPAVSARLFFPLEEYGCKTRFGSAGIGPNDETDLGGFHTLKLLRTFRRSKRTILQALRKLVRNFIPPDG
jgi:hypothetical protein